jgi:hypothetical protein
VRGEEEGRRKGRDRKAGVSVYLYFFASHAIRQYSTYDLCVCFFSFSGRD